MADRESRSSSEDILSDDSDSNLVNLYDSDVENSVVPVEQSGHVRINLSHEGSNKTNNKKLAQNQMTTTESQLRLSWKHRLAFNHFAIKLHF